MADPGQSGYDGPMRALNIPCVCAFAVVVSGCQPPDEPAPSWSAPTTVDAGSPAGAMDAGVAKDLVVEGGDVEAVPVVEHLVDAGTMADAPSPPPPPPATVSADPTHPAGRFIFDRLLVKPKAKSERPEALQKQIEKLLGQKVKSLRRTGGAFWLVQLAPTTPPRTTLDQARAIEKLQKSGAFQSVEGDQLLTLKTGLTLPTLR